MKLRITILKYNSWYLCQISLLIMLSPIQIHCNLICGKKGLNVGGKALNICTAFQVIMQQCCKTSFTLFYRSFSLLGSCPRVLCAYLTLQSTYTFLSRKKQHNMYVLCMSFHGLFAVHWGLIVCRWSCFHVDERM